MSIVIQITEKYSKCEWVGGLGQESVAGWCVAQILNIPASEAERGPVAEIRIKEFGEIRTSSNTPGRTNKVDQTKGLRLDDIGFAGGETQPVYIRKREIWIRICF